MSRAIPLAILVLLSAAPAAGGQVRVEALLGADTIGLNESVEYRVRVTGSGLAAVEEPQVNLPRGLTLFGRSHSSEVSIVNGAAARQTTFVWIYRPYRMGTIVIGPARVRVGGLAYTAPPVSVTVVERRSRPLALPPVFPDEGELEEVEPPPGLGRPGGLDPVFVSNRLDEEEVYVGEQVLLTFAFYQSPRAMVLDQPNYSSAKTPGFWTQDFNREPEISRELIGGEPYTIQRFYYALFPLTPGPKAIAPATLTLTLRNPLSVLDRGRTRTLAADTLRLTVKQLPTEGRPATFDGAVGRYQLTARVEPSEVERGAPATLVVRVSGEGNVATVPPPRMPAVAGLKVFDPEIKTRVEPRDLQVRGVKEFRYLVIPERSGELALGTVSLAYFDPTLGEYHETTADLGRIVARPASGDRERRGTASGTGLAGIRERAPEPGAAPPWRSPLYWAAVALPVVALGALLAGRGRRRRPAARSVRRPAGATLLERDPRPGSVDRVERELLAYLATREDGPGDALPMAARERALVEGGMSGQTAAAAVAALRALDAVRFAPPGTREATLAAAVSALRRFEELDRAGPAPTRPGH